MRSTRANIGAFKRGCRMTSTAKDNLSCWAPQVALMFTVAGAAWGLAWSLSGKLGRLEAKVDQNAVAIEGKAQAQAQATERNAQAIERNAQAIERNAQAIAEVQESLARLTGQYSSHLRHHNEAVASRRR